MLSRVAVRVAMAVLLEVGLVVGVALLAEDLATIRVAVTVVHRAGVLAVVRVAA